MFNDNLNNVKVLAFVFNPDAKSETVTNGTGDWFAVNFNCNSETYYYMFTELNGLPPPLPPEKAPRIVYNTGWSDEAYKTITITSKLSEVIDGNALLAWLQANATKQ